VRSDRDSRPKCDLGDYSDAACFGCSRNVIVCRWPCSPGPVCQAHGAELTNAETSVEGEDLRQHILRHEHDHVR
jgi:hypothetical protein